jgi:hypothetical protein
MRGGDLARRSAREAGECLFGRDARAGQDTMGGKLAATIAAELADHDRLLLDESLEQTIHRRRATLVAVSPGEFTHVSPPLMVTCVESHARAPVQAKM